MSPCQYRTPVIKFSITNFIFTIYDIALTQINRNHSSDLSFVIL